MSVSQNKNNGYRYLIIFFTIYAVLSYIRFPNLWSATHFLFNYDDVFLKRGLIGSLVQIVTDDVNYKMLFYLSSTILFVELLLLVLLTDKVVKSHDKFVLALVFFTSNALAFHIHSIGYLEHILILGCLYLGFCSLKRRFLYFFPLICLLGILTHELFILLALPILIIRFLVLEEVVEDGLRSFMFKIFALSVVLMVILSGMILFTEIFLFDQKQMEESFAVMSQKADFPPRYDAYKLLVRSWDVNVQMNLMGKENLVHEILIILKNHIHSIGTSLFYSLLCCYAFFNRQRHFFKNIVFLSLVFSLCFAPLALSFVAWDHERFFSFCGIISFLAFLMICSSNERMSNRVSKKSFFYYMAFIVILLNLTTVPYLFDGHDVVHFPFIQHWEFISKLSDGTVSFPSVPSR